MDFLEEEERLFHSVFVVCCMLLLSVTTAGVFCCTHGKGVIKSIFNICALVHCTVFRFEMVYHFKEDLLTLTTGTGSKPGIILQKGEVFLLQV